MAVIPGHDWSPYFTTPFSTPGSQYATPGTTQANSGMGDLGTTEIQMANRPYSVSGTPTNLEAQLDAAASPGSTVAEADIEAMVEAWAVAAGATAFTASVLVGALTIMAAAGYSGYELAQYLSRNGGSPLPPGYITGDPTGIWQDTDGFYHDSNSANPLQAYRFPPRPAPRPPRPGTLPDKPGSQQPTTGGYDIPPSGSQQPTGTSLPNRAATADPVTVGLGSIAAVTTAIASCLAATHPNCQCSVNAGGVPEEAILR